MVNDHFDTQGPNCHRGLPNELIEDIITNVDTRSPDGRRTLIACSYASRRLLPISQKKIFRDTSIKLKVGIDRGVLNFFEDDHTTGKKLLLLVNNSPHIAAYIHSITIIFAQRSAVSYSPTTSNPGTIGSGLSSFPLYDIIPKLRELKKFTFKSTGRFCWMDFEPTIQKFLRGLVQNVTEFDVYPIHSIPSSLFVGCSPLKMLHVTNLEMDTGLKPSSKAPLEFLRVRHISLPTTLKNPATIFSSFGSHISPYDFSHLSKLVISIRDLSSISRMLAFCSDTLESLELLSLGASHEKTTLFYESDNLLPVYENVIPNLGVLCKLRDITICPTIYGYDSNHVYETDIPYACAILKTLPRDMDSPACVEAILDIAIVDVPAERLEHIAWSEIIGINLSENETTSMFAKLELHFPVPVFANHLVLNVSSPLLMVILSRNEYLKMRKETGTLSYSTYDPPTLT